MHMDRSDRLSQNLDSPLLSGQTLEPEMDNTSVGSFCQSQVNTKTILSKRMEIIYAFLS